MKYSKFIVGLVILLNVVFTSAVLYLVYIGREEPSSLVVAWFSFTSVELLALAGIKIKEITKGDGHNDNLH